MTTADGAKMTPQEPARTPLLLAGAAVMGLAALTFAVKGTSYLVDAPWQYVPPAVAAAIAALVALERPKRLPLVFPLTWLWSLLTGMAVFSAFRRYFAQSGREFIVPSSHWESFGLLLLGIAAATWLIAMALTGFVLFFYSMWMTVMAADDAFDRWHGRGRRPEVSQ